MLGLGLSFDPAPLITNLCELGLITVGAAGQTLRLLPPLTVKKDEIDKALNILKTGLSKI